MRVLDSRAGHKDNSIRRRRECRACGERVTTYERVGTRDASDVDVQAAVKAIEAVITERREQRTEFWKRARRRNQKKIA